LFTLKPALPIPAVNIPNYSAMSPVEQAQHRANFITRFGTLRNFWPNYHIPDFPEDASLEVIHAHYDTYVRHIHISQGVDQYRVYLVIMWLVVELAGIKLRLNIGGYTLSQMRSMNKYEQLLTELGENNYKNNATAVAGTQSNWPVELRILFVALINAVAFIIIKMLSSSLGEGIATTIVDGLSSILSGSPPQPGQTLFGGPAAVTSGGPAGGPQPLPPLGGAFGGIDMPSMLANLGSAFLGRQAAAGAAAPAAAGTTTAAASAPATRYAAAYDG
jgi:hypothetical protein